MSRQSFWRCLVIIGALTPAAAQQGLSTITLTRTPCFGSCPVYKLEIDSTGNVLERHFSREPATDSKRSNTLRASCTNMRQRSFTKEPSPLQST